VPVKCDVEGQVRKLAYPLELGIRLAAVSCPRGRQGSWRSRWFLGCQVRFGD
jgi:hypothetical protein